MRILLLVFLLMNLTACNIENEVDTDYEKDSAKRVWVFSQFNVPAEDGDLQSYYYYGSVSENIYDAIGKNKLKSGFIQLNEISYWGDGDLIYDYKDSENSGNRIFRIEHIATLRQVNNRPVSGKGSEQFEEALDPKEVIDKETDKS